jgi:methionyl-tRNA formyltransferase
MKMDEGLDTGDILLQQEIEILPDETAVELTDRLSILGAELLSATLKNLDKIQPRQQDDTLATYAPILKKEDGLINWNLTAREISNRVRAFQPFPTSYTYFRGKRLTIWRCRQISDDSILTAEPGTLIQSSNKTLRVACGENTVLQIEELQPEGRKRIKASDFVNGWHPSSGEKFYS